MKALKSQRASELLADPEARDQIRQFLVASRLGSAAPMRQSAIGVKIQSANGRTVTAVMVPKAKAT